jgi:hypothetical protein
LFTIMSITPKWAKASSTTRPTSSGREHEDRVRAQLAQLQEALATIEYKVALYAERLAEGTADDLWRNGPECGPS